MKKRTSGSLLFLFVFLLGCGDAAQRAPRGKGAAAPEAKGKNKAGADGKPAPRKIIYTGLMDVVVDDIADAKQQLRQLVADRDGYFADSQMFNRPGGPRSGKWTVRVPQKHFEAFLDAVAKLGEVRSRTTNSKDVTDAYHDNAARLKADETEEKSLLGLLEKTQGKVEDILKVREQLRTVRGQIEERKSQLQRWDKDVEYATVTVELQDRRDYTPPLLPNFTSTIGRTFRGSVEALLNFGKAIVLVAVALAPWLAVLIVLSVPIVLMRRRRRTTAARQR